MVLRYFCALGLSQLSEKKFWFIERGTRGSYTYQLIYGHLGGLVTPNGFMCQTLPALWASLARPKTDIQRAMEEETFAAML